MRDQLETYHTVVFEQPPQQVMKEEELAEAVNLELEGDFKNMYLLLATVWILTIRTAPQHLKSAYKVCWKVNFNQYSAVEFVDKLEV